MDNVKCLNGVTDSDKDLLNRYRSLAISLLGSFKIQSEIASDPSFFLALNLKIYL